MVSCRRGVVLDLRGTGLQVESRVDVRMVHLPVFGGVRAHGEDRVRSDRGADRARLPAWVAHDPAHRLAHDDLELEALKAARPRAGHEVRRAGAG
jgi:hypothetical protein